MLLFVLNEHTGSRLITGEENDNTIVLPLDDLDSRCLREEGLYRAFTVLRYTAEYLEPVTGILFQAAYVARTDSIGNRYTRLCAGFVVIDNNLATFSLSLPADNSLHYVVRRSSDVVRHIVAVRCREATVGSAEAGIRSTALCADTIRVVRQRSQTDNSSRCTGYTHLTTGARKLRTRCVDNSLPCDGYPITLDDCRGHFRLWHAQATGRRVSTNSPVREIKIHIEGITRTCSERLKLTAIPLQRVIRILTTADDIRTGTCYCPGIFIAVQIERRAGSIQVFIVIHEVVTATVNLLNSPNDSLLLCGECIAHRRYITAVLE